MSASDSVGVCDYPFNTQIINEKSPLLKCKSVDSPPESAYFFKHLEVHAAITIDLNQQSCVKFAYQ